MTTPVSKVKFVNKSETTKPRYYKDELTALKKKGAVDMIQIPGIYSDDPKGAAKVVIGINENGRLMTGSKDIAVYPCPPYCLPPGGGGLITLSRFLS